MTSVFDGMAGVMADVFGAPVTYTPKGGDAVVIVGLLRETPVEVAGEGGGAVLMTAPTFQMPRDKAPDFQRGDRLSSVAEPAKVFSIINRIPNGSPASDAMIICELEKVLG